MHSPADRPLTPQQQAYAIERAKQLVAASRDPKSRQLLAKQIFDDAFTDECPERPVYARNGKALAGHARRDRVPELPPPPLDNPDATQAQLEQAEYNSACVARAQVIGDNERKLRALLWARAVFLELGDPDGFHVHTLESAIREWFMCSLPELPTTTAGIELCVRANARASGDELRRAAAERTSVAAE